jgi:hypothetical protein
MDGPKSLGRPFLPLESSRGENHPAIQDAKSRKERHFTIVLDLASRPGETNVQSAQAR